MKKLFFFLTCCLFTTVLFAQTGSQTNVTDTSCFCCNGFYAIPTPVIKGPTTINCGEKPVYSVKACPGATITWSVTTPNTIASGQGTNSITLAPVSGATYSVAVQIKCGNKVVENKIAVKVISVQSCKPDFIITVTQLANGYLNINAVPTLQTPGQEHWWGIQYNGTYPNCTIPCAAIPFTSFNAKTVWGGYINTAGLLSTYMGTGITTGTTPYGINYSGFPNNVCFKITQYVKCCGVFLRQTQCVSIGTSNLKAMPGVGTTLKPEITKSEIETLDKKDLPKELRDN